MQLILDRSTARTLVAFGDATLTLDGRDETWVAQVQTLLNGRCPTALAVGLGPGSFAGIRAAIAALQGMGIAWKLQPRGFPSAALFALASGLPDVTVVGDARRGTLWTVRYQISGDTIRQDSPFRIVEAEQFVPEAAMVSPDAERLKHFDLRPVETRAELLAETVRRLGSALTSDPLPIYLHPAVGAAHAQSTR